MKKTLLLIGIVILFVLVLLILYYKPYRKYQLLKNVQTIISDKIGESIYPYYREYLFPPKSFDSLVNFCESEGYDGIHILDNFMKESHISLTEDSIFVFFNYNEEDTTLNDRVDFFESSFLDYAFLKKDIVVFKWRKLEYCEIEITRPRFFKRGQIYTDTTVLPRFYGDLYLKIQEQIPSNIDFFNASSKKRLLLEVDMANDKTKLVNIISCDEFLKMEKLKRILLSVLSETEFNNNEYEKAIIPILISPETIQ
ncbi:MAG: hypothetical protein A2W93_00680 [Bacteroidetes bacterium GWF2_43_63]|nr:MAG: hypothetical protein A2W94_10970 [Bacteroidetes bacterium GWE2_42_42]OFY54975.1 MAG: hypothetical protein A2W93_00680 [Bacteroidetes bacterium GWF2_43_63]HBG69517.1 hypothetical protein [Bacteroidales bacterium]HCB61316.1 hypothetical protein [Bacteroidales bacterium]